MMMKAGTLRYVSHCVFVVLLMMMKAGTLRYTSHCVLVVLLMMMKKQEKKIN